MPQFQGSLGPLKDLEDEHSPGPPQPSKNGSLADAEWNSKLRANRRLAYALLCSAFLWATCIALAMGWLDRWLP
jgi:hypothetical protein